MVLKHLKTRWDEERALQSVELAGFRNRLEQRWGQALNGLRMLLNDCPRLGARGTQQQELEESSKSSVIT